MGRTQARQGGAIKRHHEGLRRNFPADTWALQGDRGLPAAALPCTVADAATVQGGDACQVWKGDRDVQLG